VRRYRDEIGGLDWAAPQDWMCEPEQVAKTGMTEKEHQQRTVENFVELRTLAPDLRIVPVVQGWVIGSHLRCVEMYLDAGVDLFAEPIVGIGSVCRRPNPVSVALIVDQLHAAGLRRLHGFGVTADPLALSAEHLGSADSQAWSAGARHRREPCPESTTRKDCRNCLHYALEWAEQVHGTAGWWLPMAFSPTPTSHRPPWRSCCRSSSFWARSPGNAWCNRIRRHHRLAQHSTDPRLLRHAAAGR
jgi:hypothetical protein